MITDIEIKTKGFHVLAKYLGDIEAERFIALIQQEPFDYILVLKKSVKKQWCTEIKSPNNSATCCLVKAP